ncbi:MAG: hypothetical protein WA061_02040 [Microgenomates group bacterium]
MPEKHKYGRDYWFKQDDISLNEEGIPESVFIVDDSGKTTIGRVYQLYENTKGMFIVFHGQREYILEK